MLKYAIELTPDDNDTFLVTCPDLPEVTTFGETEEDAISYGQSAVEEAVTARLAGFEDIPRAKAKSRFEVKVSLQLALKVLLKWQLDANEITRYQLAKAMGKARPQIDRLFDPTHGTKIDQYEAAAHALGATIEISIR